MQFDYSDSPYPIRADLPASYREVWLDLSRAGTWWTGAERVAMIAESRVAVDCKLCRERKEAVSPYAVEGSHDRAPGSESVLSEAAVNVIHRVITDQSRLTQRYVDEALAAGLTNESLVELLGVILCAISIDDFHRGLGLALEPLPEPIDGEPSRYEVPQAHIDRDTAFVPVLNYDAAVGNEDDLWNSDTGVTNVMRGLSLVPNAVREWKKLCETQYMPLDKIHDLGASGDGPLDRVQVELIASRVSAVNECFF